VPPAARWSLGALALALLAFGAVADHALLEQARASREESAASAREAARLTALSVRAALAQVEQQVVAGRPVEGVVAERLAAVPRRAAPQAGSVPYASRPRAELAQLLHSTRTTDQGLPEAVVARIALGESTLSLGDATPMPDVRELLVSGQLPADPDDLPHLAEILGARAPARVAAVQRRLREAPAAETLPRAPAFRRRLIAGGSIEAWTLDGHRRLRYDVPAATLLRRAGVLGTVTALPPEAAAPPGRVTADVPDVEGLTLAAEPGAGRELRFRALRGLLWTAVAAALFGFVAVGRAVGREARATAREKAFLASVTHELRSPLAAIRLFGETLAEGRGEPREYGALVAQETERLEDLVERVLAATRAGAAPAFAPARAAEIVRSALALVAPRAEKRAVTMRCHLEEDLPEVRWDAPAVRGALLNLLDNAVRHGRPGGRVEVRASAEGSLVRLAVADDGPGIARAQRRKVFGRFQRGSTDGPGTGLGLYLVDEVARAHGGRVDLESDEARGCTFTLVLPAFPPQASVPPAEPGP
jgi:signal transduction histidine kinase